MVRAASRTEVREVEHIGNRPISGTLMTRVLTLVNGPKFATLILMARNPLVRGVFGIVEEQSHVSPVLIEMRRRILALNSVNLDVMDVERRTHGVRNRCGRAGLRTARDARPKSRPLGVQGTGRLDFLPGRLEPGVQ